MKPWLLSALIFATLCLVAAAQTTEQQWQQEAVRHFPALGVRGTPLNNAYVAEYQRRKPLPSEAQFFANPRWPMLLAEECARQLAAGTALKASPHPGLPTPSAAATPGLPAPGRAPAFPAKPMPFFPLVVGLSIVSIIGGLIGAVIVRLATRSIAGFTPSFGMACRAVFWALAASPVVGLAIGWLTSSKGGGMESSTSLLLFVIGFAIQAFIYGEVLKDPEAVMSIGFRKGCSISVIQTVGVGFCLFLAAATLPLNSFMQSRATETRSLSQAKSIATVCKHYASEHGGKFPPSLEALVPDYVPTDEIFHSPFRPEDPQGYIYTPDLTDSSPADLVLVEDKFSVEMDRAHIVAHVDTSAVVLRVPRTPSTNGTPP